MATRWVSNSSPLILLARCGQADLLWKACDELVIPHSVASEILAYPHTDGAQQIVQAGDLAVVADRPVLPAVEHWNLGAGESAVLVFALEHPGWIAVLDDGLARRAAAALGVPHIGTIAVILRAKALGLIPEVRSMLALLTANGARPERSLIETALQAAGEDG